MTLTIIIRIRAEQISKDLCIFGSITRPHIPHIIAQRVGDEVVLGAFQRIVRDVRRLGVGILRGVEILRWQEAHVFAPEHAAESSGVTAGLEGLAVHGAFKDSAVFHHDGELAVVETQLGLRSLVRALVDEEGTYAVVDVGATTDDDPVIYNTYFAVDIELFLDKILLFLLGVAFPVQIGGLFSTEHGAFGDCVFAFWLSVFLARVVTLCFEFLFLVHDSFLLFLLTMILVATA